MKNAIERFDGIKEAGKVFPKTQVVALEQSGHWPFADDPSSVAEVVVPFLHHMAGG